MERYSCTDNSPKYKGVRKRKWGKWVSEIRLPNSRERIWLGSFDSSEKAARAFDAALYCLRGPGASFNFPENPPEIPGGRSLTPQEIQAVASRFANEEPLPRQRPRTDDVGISARGENVCGGGRGPMAEEQVAGNSSNNHNDTTEYEDKTTTDWSFLLGNEVGPSEFGYFPGLDNDEHMNLFYPTTQHPPSGFYDDGGDEDSSQQSFSLWDF